METCGSARQATDGEAAYTICMLDNVKLQTHTQNVKYLLLSHHCNISTNAAQSSVYLQIACLVVLFIEIYRSPGFRVRR
jgi:hypothetical protein